MKTSSCKSKGRLLQQLVRDRICKLLKPYGVVAEDVKSTSMGVSGVDIQLSPFAKQFLPIAAECKSMKSVAVYKWYKQGKNNTKAGEETVLCIKQNNDKPLVVVDLDHYLSLWKSKIDYEDL